MASIRRATCAAAFVILACAPSASGQALPASCTFSDDPISAGTVLVKKAHVDELRVCINDLRAQRSLGTVGWTDPVLTAQQSWIRAVHIIELRSALTEAYTAAGVSAPGFAQTITAAVTTIRASHINELRSAARNVPAPSPACSYSVWPNTLNFHSKGGPGTIDVNVDGSCSWTATATASWITFSGSSSGRGNGSVSFTVGINNNSDGRSAQITIEGRTVTVNQAGTSGGGGGDEETSRLMSAEPGPQMTVPCGWQYWWDPPDAFADVDVELRLSDSGRSYRTQGHGLFGFIEVTVTLDGTYLPSTNYQCGSFGAIVYPAEIYVLPWEYVDMTWPNPSCDGYPPLRYGSQPTSSYWVSEELYNTNAMMGAAAATAGTYWTQVGEQLSYTTLRTNTGGDVVVYPHPFPQPMFAGQFDWPYSRTLWLNTVHFPQFTSEQWAWITAHELGHAIGFDDVPVYDDRTIMMEGGIPYTSLVPRPLDKCAAVRAFPVDIQIGR